MPVRATLQFRKDHQDKSKKSAIVEILLPKGVMIARDAKRLPAEVWEALQKSPEGIAVEYGTELTGETVLPLALAERESNAVAKPAEAALPLIKKVSEDFLRVTFDKPLPKKGWAGDATLFQVTDKALGLIEGNQFREPKDGENPGFVIEKFSEDTTTAPGIAGTKPDINRNPYNFVGLAGEKPWLDQPNGSHPGHDGWWPDLLCGTVKVNLKAKTPVFVPAGFPLENDQTTMRHFCKLHKREREHYAIPGSSFKGPLRAMVEAIANDYFGVANKEEYSRKIPYRRRVFQVGQVEQRAGEWFVHPHRVPRGAQAGPGKFLLNRPPASAGVSTGLPTPAGLPIRLAGSVVRNYHDLLDHPHFRRYYENSVANADKRAHDELPVYQEDLKTLGFNKIKRDLQLNNKDWIYYTKTESNEIDSFGKNVNYLWPSLKSVKDLAGEYFSPPRDLNSPLGLADRMFGFASDHTAGSHPFRGKLRFETLWGPEAENVDPIELKLAPLTSPATRAKARPLYLMPKPKSNDSSASYSDSDPDPAPVLRGRKFYWRQNPGNRDQVWLPHRASKAHPSPQLPPPIKALPAGVEFEGRIHFRNLSREELGALLFVIEGARVEGWEHTLQLGKGKPRGLGTLGVTSVVTLEDRDEAWKSLSAPTPVLSDESTARKTEECRLAFAKWGLRHAKEPTDSPLETFQKLPHVEDFIALNRWPEDVSVRYYPLHFSEYSWLPTENQNPDVPKEPHKVKAMRRAGAEFREWWKTRTN